MNGLKISDENKLFLKTLLALAPPIVLQEIMSASVNIMDAVMIGTRMGIHEITAVGLANQIFFIFAVIVFSLNGGVSVFVGQFYGKNDHESIHKTMGIAFIFNTSLAALFFCLAFFIPEILLNIYSNDPIVIALGAGYLRIIAVSYFFTAIALTRNSSMRAIGQTRIPMISTSITLICNFTFNYISIFVLELGIGGIAAGTVVARFLELIIQQIFIKKYKLPVQANSIKDYFSFDKTFVISFFRVSIFIVFSGIMWSVGTSTYNIAYGFISTEAQGAVQISSAMMQLFQVFGTSLGISTSIIISNTLGKGDIPLAIKYARKCIYSGIVISAIMGTFLIILSPIIIGFYNVDEQVEMYVTRILYVVSVGMMLRVVNFVSLTGILRSGGDTKFVFFVGLIGVWVIAVPLAFIGAIYLNLPVYFVVLLVHAEELFKVCAALLRVRSNKWAKTIV